MIAGEIAKEPIGKSLRLFHPALLPCLAACEEWLVWAQNRKKS